VTESVRDGIDVTESILVARSQARRAEQSWWRARKLAALRAEVAPRAEGGPGARRVLHHR
jgi:hypothetical protein